METCAIHPEEVRLALVAFGSSEATFTGTLSQAIASLIDTPSLAETSCGVMELDLGFSFFFFHSFSSLLEQLWVLLAPVPVAQRPTVPFRLHIRCPTP